VKRFRGEQRVAIHRHRIVIVRANHGLREIEGVENLRHARGHGDLLGGGVEGTTWGGDFTGVGGGVGGRQSGQLQRLGESAGDRRSGLGQVVARLLPLVRQAIACRQSGEGGRPALLHHEVLGGKLIDDGDLSDGGGFAACRVGGAQGILACVGHFQSVECQARGGGSLDGHIVLQPLVHRWRLGDDGGRECMGGLAKRQDGAGRRSNNIRALIHDVELNRGAGLGAGEVGDDHVVVGFITQACSGDLVSRSRGIGDQARAFIPLILWAGAGDRHAEGRGLAQQHRLENRLLGDRDRRDHNSG